MSTLPTHDSLDRSLGAVSLRTQYDPALLGVPASGVRLTWRVDASSDASAAIGRQLSHRIADGPWIDAEPEADAASIGIAAPGGDLAPRERRAYRVRVATETGWSDWSAPATAEAGLPAVEWGASAIGLDHPVEGPSPILRTTFSLDAAPSDARLYVSYLGLGEVWINGQRVGDEHLAPGWTAYRDRVLVSTLDVADLLQAGENAIAILLGDGWYRGHFGFAGRERIYGDEAAAIARLEAGDTVVVTDASWTGGTGSVRAASIYDGTDLDLRLTTAAAASRVGFDASAFGPVSVVATDLERFAPRIAPPVRTIAEFTPATIANGVLDVGQNISGWMRVTVRGTAGDTVVVRHAELVDAAGALYTAPLRSARATDTYVLAVDGESVLEPVFTFHGFQYAQVTGAELVSATAVAISSDLPVRSSFRSDHAALDKFHSNVQWSQRDNFVSVPTDCPQRDERLGWTGDAQAFSATASTLLDSQTFWLSWLRDLELDQTDEGGVASVVPDIIAREDMRMGDNAVDPMGRAGWADAATITPLAVYDSYGSDEVLVQQLRSMRRWVEHLRGRAGTEVVLPRDPFQYSDWLDPDAPGDRPWLAKVDEDFVTNAFYVHSTRLLARAERLVGDVHRAADYEALADVVAAETWARWGRTAYSTQTGAALALEFRIAPDTERSAIADSLAAHVRTARGRISTGFLGTPLVLFALSNSGHLDEAYLMLLCREAPSWLYQVDRGATTVWERWDAIKEDGSIHSGTMDAGGTEATESEGNMLSFNHYAYGAMIDWVYRTVAGLSPAEPGYRVARVAPRPSEELRHAAASIDTPFGELAIEWTVEGDEMRIVLDVPYGSTAVLDLPVTAASTVSGPSGTVAHGHHEIVVTAAALAAARDRQAA